MNRLLVATVGVVACLSAVATAQVKVGQPAPDLKLDRIYQAQNAPLDLSALKGKVVVLEFWATWCAPCISAMPHMNELAEKVKGKGVQFVSISDESAETIEPFLKKGLMKTWVGQDKDGSMYKTYGIRFIPHTIVLDKAGNVALVTSPTALNEEILDKVARGETLAGVAPEAAKPENPAAEPLYQLEIRPSGPRRQAP
jgi:thiol-disulfide isomerase/thioredoxin